jgi:tetratricopeptide (TPR) repeat protein
VQQHYEQGAYGSAEQLAREALRTSPEDPGVQLYLGLALSARGHTEALAIADKLRQHDNPTVRCLANNLWAWHAYLLGDEPLRTDAVRAIDEALSLASEPNTHAAILDTRAHVALWSKRYADAERDFLASLNTKHRKASGRMISAAGLAMVYAATDRPDEARAYLAKARAEGIEHDILARATAAVEPLSRS